MRVRLRSSLLALGVFICAGPARAQLAPDSDGDGVIDAADAQPCDPRVAAERLVPADRTYGMLLFEDLWPKEGDFDFNDLVIAYHQALRLDASGRLSSVRLEVEVMAVGARFSDGLAFHLPVPRGAVASVALSVAGALQNPTPWASESELVVTLADRLHPLFQAPDGAWINTDPAAPVDAVVHLSLDVQLTSGQEVDFGKAPFDLFLFDRTRGVEVHRPEYRGTSRLDAALVGTVDDGTSSTRAFVTRAGVPFALDFPELVAYPREGDRIDQLYPEIVLFGASGGTSAVDFYRTQVITPHVFPGQVAPGPLSATASPDTSCYTPTPGVCGLASGTGHVSAPSADLCAFGAASAVATDGQTFSWSCAGFYSSLTVCTAPDLVCAPNAVEDCSAQFPNSVATRTCTGAGDGYTACHVTACNPGYFQSGDTCFLQICAPAATRPCTIPNATAQETCNNSGTGWGACQLVSCQAGYSQVGQTCQQLLGTNANTPALSCLAILRAGASTGDGYYWLDTDGAGPRAPFQARCDMSTDGGGFTVCAGQSFDAASRFLGRSQLSSTWGDITTNQFGVDCARIMAEVAGTDRVELMLKGSAVGEWQWIYPVDATNFYDHVVGARDADCDSAAPRITQCKGSASGGVVVTNKQQACHSSGQHRTSDSYFIWQAADATNSNVLFELGQGDGNHPIGIRPNCDGSGWFGGCGRPAGSYPYQSANYCGSGREYGAVTVAFRERSLAALSPPDGTTQAHAGSGCKQILSAGYSTGSGVYWIDPNGGSRADAVDVYCDMNTDGGGWTVCASQDFSGANRYLGVTALGAGQAGSAASNQWYRGCAALMKATAPGGDVELMLKGSAVGEWQWIYPVSTDNFYAHVLGSNNTNCETSLPRVSECRGSATVGTVAVSKYQACHSYSPHRNTDHYFIWQAADNINSNVLFELGQGDANHPIGIRPDCGGSGWWGGCGRPAGSYPYQSSNYCGSGREYGVVSVAFRTRG